MRRTIIGIVFVVAALLRLAQMWGFAQLTWLKELSWTDYFGPLLVLYVGIELIIYGFSHSHNQWLQHPVPSEEEGKRICCSVRFGGDEYIYRGETFHGARLDAFCGGIRLDLRGAVITEDEEIDIHIFIGGVELYIPKDINVIVKSRSFIGTVDNETNRNVKSNVPCIHIVANNFFGGVSINN